MDKQLFGQQLADKLAENDQSLVISKESYVWQSSVLSVAKHACVVVLNFN